MLARCSISRVSTHTTHIRIVSRIKTSRGHVRRLASTAATADASQGASLSGLPVFGGLSTELDKLAPRFEIEPDQIDILREPKDFYEALKTKISNAKNRIYISTLYIGKTEQELITTIRDALRKNPKLTISFLTDALRGTREAPDPSCASLLAPLIAEFGGARVQIRMFHTPNLTVIRKAILPKRINEGWGLQHMKLYGIDDELIMSGANLSSDYFTNRQDRYHVFRSKTLTDYYERVHDAVSSMSFDVQPEGAAQSGFALIWPKSHTGPSPLQDPKAYIHHASNLLEPLIKPSAATTAAMPGTESASSDKRTVVYPLFQLAPLLPGDKTTSPSSTELPALGLILRSLSTAPFAPARWTFTAGYFNMTPFVRDLLLSSLQQMSQSSVARVNEPNGTVITAHPHANGFYRSKGVSGLLPPAYTLMARRFLGAVNASGMPDRLSLHEWKRGMVDQPDGWTYHAKGLWVTLPSASTNSAPESGVQHAGTGPALTLVGSSNYTARSHTLDLEANALILTNDQDLRRRLGEEEKHLMEYAGPKIGMVEFQKPERRVGIVVRVALWIVGVVGGAL